LVLIIFCETGLPVDMVSFPTEGTIGDGALQPGTPSI
jgi:hypothetical protein